MMGRLALPNYGFIQVLKLNITALKLDGRYLLSLTKYNLTIASGFTTDVFRIFNCERHFLIFGMYETLNYENVLVGSWADPVRVSG
jgi:hypothetical protein